MDANVPGRVIARLRAQLATMPVIEQATRKTASTVAASEPERGGMTAGRGGDEPIADRLSRRWSGGQVPARPRPGTVVFPLPGELAFSNADQVEAALPAEAATELPTG